MRAGSVAVYASPSLVDGASLRGGVAVVIDLLRASTTICRALAAGAEGVMPFLTPEEAVRARGGMDWGRCVLAGERRGVLIKGFDLANSPGEFTPERVRGRVVLFTTTNGTRAAAMCGAAARVLVGCFNNLTAVVDEAARDGRTVHLVCAGTRDRLEADGEGEAGAGGAGVTLEDCLCAGSMVLALVERGLGLGGDDQSAVMAALARGVGAGAGERLGAMRGSLGGRNLAALGLGADVEACAEVDTVPVVPELDRGAGMFRAVRTRR